MSAGWLVGGKGAGGGLLFFFFFLKKINHDRYVFKMGNKAFYFLHLTNTSSVLNLCVHVLSSIGVLNPVS